MSAADDVWEIFYPEDAPPAPGSSLEVAQAHLQERLEDGINCPCCGQFAKRYRRKLNSGIAAWLLVLVRLYRETAGWAHTRDVIQCGIFRLSSAHGSGQAQSLLPHWGLIEAHPGKNTGLWRPTELGLDFAFGTAQVQCRVIIYNNACEGLEGDRISIHDALGDKFDYAELMNAHLVSA